MRRKNTNRKISATSQTQPAQTLYIRNKQALLLPLFTTAIFAFVLYEFLSSNSNFPDSISRHDNSNLPSLSGSTLQNLMKLGEAYNFSPRAFPMEEKLKQMQVNLEFKRWVENLKLQVDDDPSLPDWSPVYTNIYNALKIFSENTFLPNLVDPTLKIVVTTHAKLQRRNGMFMVKENTIVIPYIEVFTVQDYVLRLRNEFFSHQVTRKNLVNKISAPPTLHDLGLPFLNRAGKIDNNKLVDFRNSIGEVTKATAKLLTLFNSGSASNEINALISLTEDYYPLRFYISPQEWGNIRHTAHKHGRLHELQANEIYVFESNNKDAFNKYIYIKPDGIFYTLSSLQESNRRNKAYALLCDIVFMITSIQESPEYLAKKPESQLVELASFFAHFDTKIQRFICPDLYNFMTRFFTEDYQLEMQPEVPQEKSVHANIGENSKENKMYKLSQKHFLSDSVKQQKRIEENHPKNQYQYNNVRGMGR